MIKPEIRVTVHEDYTQTTLRVYRGSAMDYTEYSVFGRTFLENIMNPNCVDDVVRAVGTYENVDYKTRYNEGFKRYVTLCYKVEPENVLDFTIKEARSISMPHGGRDIKGAFTSQTLGLRILTNILTYVHECNFSKLSETLDLLEKVGGQI